MVSINQHVTLIKTGMQYGTFSDKQFDQKYDLVNFFGKTSPEILNLKFCKYKTLS